MNSGGEEKKIGEDINFPLLNSNSFKLIEKKIKKMNKMISKKCGGIKIKMEKKHQNIPGYGNFYFLQLGLFYTNWKYRCSDESLATCQDGTQPKTAFCSNGVIPTCKNGPQPTQPTQKTIRLSDIDFGTIDEVDEEIGA